MRRMQRPLLAVLRTCIALIVAILGLPAVDAGSVSLQTAAAGRDPQDPAFKWPAGKRAAISLSFDDGRTSQVDVGLGVLDASGVKATFYVVPGAVADRREGWRRAVAAGHEIGNHSLTHPCSGNFPWARDKALEQFTLAGIRRELEDANSSIAEALGVTPVTFAYPCGQTFVGRGEGTTSYVPVVSRLFIAGRGWLDEAPNDPVAVDLAQVFGASMDDQTFEELRPLVEQTLDRGGWLVLAGHDIGSAPGRQVTRVDTLRALLTYAADPSRGFWLDTVAKIAGHVRASR
jgi:peptidoglycan/xylan/chitin deacetylase (PgdA/CDA1 family)